MRSRRENTRAPSWLRLLGASLCAALILAFISPAVAQETQPGDACTAGETDLYRLAGGPENPGAGYLLVCDGSNWNAVMTWDSANGMSLFQVDNDAAACDAARLGRIRYNGTSTWEYCNDAGAWVSFGGGGGGAFTDLSDTPSSYSGNALKHVRVNSAANALEFVAGGGGGLWSDSGSGYIEYNDALGGIRVGGATGLPAPAMP